MLHNLIDLVRDGEQVTAGTTNRPTRKNSENAAYIWQVLQAALLGRALVIRSQAIDPACEVGQPVYYDSTRSRYARALAFATVGADGVLRPAASSQVWGVILTKTSSSVADIVIQGVVPLDLTASAGVPGDAGTYYLSSSTAGGLTSSSGGFGIPVLRADGAGNVLVQATTVDSLRRHIHRHFDLYCRPAGTNVAPDPGQPQSIADADESQPGWLPADHAVFEGNAPAGAFFGYNLSQHAELAAVWPPVPAGDAYLEWNGLDPLAMNGVVMGSDALCIIDEYGIWWMTNCYGKCPWLSSFPESESESISDGEGTCDGPSEMRMKIWFTKPSFGDAGVVTSLRSISDNLIVRCRNGAEGSVGDLQIDLDLDFTTTEDANGYLVLKTQSGNTFTRGPVVEGIYTEAPNVTISAPLGTRRRLIVGDVTSPWLYQGPVQISVSADPYRELEVAQYRLDGAVETEYEGLQLIGLPAARDSSVVCKFVLPATTGLTTPQATLRLYLAGSDAGELPELTVTARRVVDPGDAAVDLPLSAEDFTVTIDTTGTLASDDQYRKSVSTAFSVTDGDVVYLTISRADDDAYAGDVSIVRMTVLLSSGS